MAPALLDVADLACRRGGRKVFDGLSFRLAAGELLALLGPNGSGKTTLLRALALLLAHDRGTICWQDRDVLADAETWRAEIAWLGHLDGLKGDLTVRENLLIAERLRSARPADANFDDALVTFDLVALTTRPVRTLSAGQRRRTALARVMMSQAPVWLLDEPLNALDELAQQAFRTALGRHLAAGGVAIAATHAELGMVQARSLTLGGAS